MAARFTKEHLNTVVQFLKRYAAIVLRHLDNDLFMQSLPMLFGLVATLFLVRGAFMLTVEDVTRLSMPAWDFNLTVLRNLTKTHADTRVGFYLFLISLFLQVMMQFRPGQWKDIKQYNQDVRMKAMLVTVISFFIIFISAHITSFSIQKNFFKKAILLTTVLQQNQP